MWRAKQYYQTTKDVNSGFPVENSKFTRSVIYLVETISLGCTPTRCTPTVAAGKDVSNTFVNNTNDDPCK